MGKPTVVEDVSLENNQLFKTVNGAKTQAGEVIFPPNNGTENLIYDETWGSYYSIASTAKLHPGQFNIGIGAGTFENAAEQTCNYNIHIGQRAGWKTITAKNNVYIGWEAGRENTYGSENVGISEDALRDNTTGFNNVAIGRGAMISNNTGKLNTAVGYNALQAQHTGEGNTALGQYALAWKGKGDNNTAVGGYALETNNDQITVNNAIGIGFMAGITNEHSDVILVGNNVHTDKNGGINIGGVYKGNVLTGAAEVESISISGRQVTVDDDYIYVKTSTGVMKKIALQNL
jgi:hypothetical protein